MTDVEPIATFEELLAELRGEPTQETLTIATRTLVEVLRRARVEPRLLDLENRVGILPHKVNPVGEGQSTHAVKMRALRKRIGDLERELAALRERPVPESKRQREVMTRLCRLLSRVNDELTHCVEASDCFCGEGMPIGPYRCGETALAFIEESVRTALALRASPSPSAGAVPESHMKGEASCPEAQHANTKRGGGCSPVAIGKPIPPIRTTEGEGSPSASAGGTASTPSSRTWASDPRGGTASTASTMTGTTSPETVDGPRHTSKTTIADRSICERPDYLTESSSRRTGSPTRLADGQDASAYAARQSATDYELDGTQSMPSRSPSAHTATKSTTDLSGHPDTKPHADAGGEARPMAYDCDGCDGAALHHYCIRCLDAKSDAAAEAARRAALTEAREAIEKLEKRHEP